MGLRTLPIFVALLALTGCAAGGSQPEADKASTSTPSATANAEGSPSATPTAEDGWWARYGLPAPGSDGYGVTVHRDPFAPTGGDRLTAFSAAERRELFAFVETLYDFGYWDLAHQPTAPAAHRYDAYFSRDVILDQVQAVKNGGTGFGTVSPDPDSFYGYEVRDLKVRVLDQLAPGGDAGKLAAARLRLSWTSSFVGATPPGTKVAGKTLEPTEYTSHLTSEVVVGDLGSGRDQFKVLSWRTQMSGGRATPLPETA